MSRISNEEGNGVMHTVNNNKTGSGNTKRHCKRFWWLYLLILLIIIVAIVVPCVLLIAVPRMAQKKLNEAKLSIDGITVTNAQTDSLNMAINSTITTDDSTHATIDGFEGTMYLADVNPPLAFAKIDFPQTTSHALQTVNISQQIPISDSNALTTFNEHLIRQESIYVMVQGDTHAHVRGISCAYPVTFRKTVPLKGLNSFKGLSVTNPHVNTGQFDNFNATAHIPNPSDLTLDIGNTTFHTYFNNTEIGTAYILNVVLRAGMTNDFFIWADINETTILEALTQRPWCERNGTLTFQLAGKNVTNNGQALPYFATALGATNASVDIPIGQAVWSDIGLSIACSD
ncbi:uncharacterized protein F4822DRAFT_231237 [Hypoxylon trugodes]|uniref:uncharacterized protein n=1 Tax=Hypoxylon trugodes TaxID=326681 RepID=UPI00219117BD|nr:uncharacterized protein F4822DRAFT_231237 [Hypoxylon trugodes]KAI1390275.1 hypothetical protein F4822DRAFT_231237 [Hypoxylon trugodes]